MQHNGRTRAVSRRPGARRLRPPRHRRLRRVHHRHLGGRRRGDRASPAARSRALAAAGHRTSSASPRPPAASDRPLRADTRRNTARVLASARAGAACWGLDVSSHDIAAHGRGRGRGWGWGRGRGRDGVPAVPPPGHLPGSGSPQHPQRAVRGRPRELVTADPMAPSRHRAVPPRVRYPTQSLTSVVLLPTLPRCTDRRPPAQTALWPRAGKGRHLDDRPGAPREVLLRTISWWGGQTSRTSGLSSVASREVSRSSATRAICSLSGRMVVSPGSV